MFFVVEEDGEVVFWREGGDGGVGEGEGEGGRGWDVVFDSSSVRKANQGRGRKGISHSFSLRVLVCSQSKWRAE